MAGINMLSQVGGDGVYGGYDWGDDADDNNVTTTSTGGSPNKNIAVSIEISEKKHGGANPFDAGESGTATTGDSKKKSQNPFDALTNESEWDNNDKADDPQSYMSIYDELNAGIDEIERNINRIKKLHNQYASIASSSTEAGIYIYVCVCLFLISLIPFPFRKKKKNRINERIGFNHVR